jgi:hypothetical protein
MNSISPVLTIYYNNQSLTLFENYLKLNGFRINKIGKIKDYISEEYNYVSGKIIRLDDFEGTADEYYELTKELEMGLFIEDFNKE